MSDEVRFDFSKKIDDIKNNPRKMWMGLISLLIILLALVYIAFFNERVDMIKFSDGCNETYVNGKLNSSECTASREAIRKQQQNNIPNRVFNFTLQ